MREGKEKGESDGGGDEKMSENNITKSI